MFSLSSFKLVRAVGTVVQYYSPIGTAPAP